MLIALLMMPTFGLAQTLSPPLSGRAIDAPGDDGTAIQINLTVRQEEFNNPDIQYVIQWSEDPRGPFTSVDATEVGRSRNTIRLTVSDAVRGQDYWVRAATSNEAGEESAFIDLTPGGPVRAVRQWFDTGRTWLLIITLVVCGSVVLFVQLARMGMPLKVRKIAGLDAIEEAVGRATEMGRSCIYIPGIQDMNNMQTIAGLTILSRVAEQAAAYDCALETPTSRSLVMTAARETMESAYLSAGRPDAYNEDSVYYVTDEQFAFVSYLTGKMVREKPAACFYLGAFYAESLILAETGNAIGAIQVAGTGEPAQLPFFVAACDYTLIGEELFAASAYLSRQPDQLGSLKGQDVGKMIAGVLVIAGVCLVSVNAIVANPVLTAASDYLQNVILHSGG